MNHTNIEMNQFTRKLIKLSLTLLLFLGLNTLGIVKTHAQNDTSVTVYFYSDQPSDFDLQKVADRSATALRQNGVSVSEVAKVTANDLTALPTHFKLGESAKIITRIVPGTVIQGGALSSYPVTIFLDVVDINGDRVVSGLKKSARSQHTNPNSGLTNSISRAMESAIKEIVSDLVGLETWSQDSAEVIADTAYSGNEVPSNETAIAGTSGINNRPQTQPAPSTSASINTPTANGTAFEPQPSNVAKNTVPGECDEQTRNVSLSAIPNTLSPGESLRLVSCYSISSSENSKANFATILSSPSGKKSVVMEDVIERTAGYWRAEYDINIPEQTTSGIYTLIQLISHEGRVVTLEEKMIVR